MCKRCVAMFIEHEIKYMRINFHFSYLWGPVFHSVGYWAPRCSPSQSPCYMKRWTEVHSLKMWSKEGFEPSTGCLQAPSLPLRYLLLRSRGRVLARPSEVLTPPADQYPRKIAGVILCFRIRAPANDNYSLSVNWSSSNHWPLPPLSLT